MILLYEFIYVFNNLLFNNKNRNVIATNIFHLKFWQSNLKTFFPKIRVNKNNILFTSLHNLCLLNFRTEVWIFLFTVKLLTWGNVIFSEESNEILTKNYNWLEMYCWLTRSFHFPSRLPPVLCIEQESCVLLAAPLARLGSRHPMLL